MTDVVKFLFRSVVFVISLLMLFVLIYSIRESYRSVDVSLVGIALKTACSSGSSSMNITLDNKPRSIFQRVLGIGEEEYIRTYGDPKFVVYYSRLSPIHGYLWDRYVNRSTNVADFGIGEYRKGDFIESLSEKLLKNASILGYDERIAINVYKGEKGILVFGNVIADNGIVNYTEHGMKINSTNKYSYLWKYFYCGEGICSRKGDVVSVYGKGCKKPVVYEKSLIPFSVHSPCKAEMEMKSGICKCSSLEIPIIKYDAEVDQGIVVAVRKTCIPSSIERGDDEIPCITVSLSEKEDCVFNDQAVFLLLCKNILFKYDKEYNYYELNMNPDKTSKPISILYTHRKCYEMLKNMRWNIG